MMNKIWIKQAVAITFFLIILPLFNLPNGIMNGGIIEGNMLGSIPPMPGAPMLGGGGKFGREVPQDVGVAPLVPADVDVPEIMCKENEKLIL